MKKVASLQIRIRTISQAKESHLQSTGRIKVSLCANCSEIGQDKTQVKGARSQIQVVVIIRSCPKCAAVDEYAHIITRSYQYLFVG